MGTTVRVEWKGSGLIGLVAALERDLESAKNLRPLLGRLGREVLVTSQQIMLERSEFPRGQEYKELRPRTIKDKIRLKSPWPTKPLWRFSVMYQSIVYRIDGSTAKAGPTARTKKGFPYPVVMNMGSPSRRIPRRTFIGIRPAEHALIGKAARKYILESLARVRKESKNER